MVNNSLLRFKNGIVISAIVVYALTGTIFAQQINVSSGTNIVARDGVFFTCGAGTFTNNGVLTNTAGTLRFSGAITFAGTGTTRVKDLTVDHSGTASVLNNRISVIGALTVINGTLNANNNLTLVSNATGSAVIAPVLGSITGKITVERYIASGKRAFRFLTPSVTIDNFISANWQLSTHITGSTSGANGFDATISGNPSLFIYNNNQITGTGWAAVTNTNATNLNAMQGYRLLLRGDRTSTLISQASADNMNVPITLAATGTVITGTVTFNSSSSVSPINNTNNSITNGFSLIGNPYVNTVNWNSLAKTALTDAYYVWDSNMGTTAERGRYIAFSSTTGTNNVSSSVNQFIQPGQAFFIKNTTLGTAGSITFNEANKLGTNINNFYRTTTTGMSRLELQVYETSEFATGGYPIDGAVSVFDSQFTNNIENGDVSKLSTGTENISFLNNSTAVAIDARPQVVATDVLLVQLEQFRANKSYTFKVNFTNFDVTATPYLLDTYNNEYTLLANIGATTVSFNTTADALSFATSRFKIVFQINALNNAGFNMQNVVVYPNPVVNNQFSIALPDYLTGEVAVKIINTLGQAVYDTKIEAGKTIIISPNNTLTQGIYFVEVTNQEKSITKKIIIQY